MFDQITALGYGIITFAVLIGIGTIILYNLGGTTASCAQATCGATAYWNSTNGACSNATAGNCGSPSGTAYTNMNYMLTQLGTSGLAGWTPAIIALSIGLLFLGAFLVGKGGKKGRY